MNRDYCITVKELKEALSSLPDNATISTHNTFDGSGDVVRTELIVDGKDATTEILIFEEHRY
jgi:hypothetical protein